MQRFIGLRNALPSLSVFITHLRPYGGLPLNDQLDGRLFLLLRRLVSLIRRPFPHGIDIVCRCRFNGTMGDWECYRRNRALLYVP